MAAPQCPVCLDCNSLVAAATNKGSEEATAIKTELKKAQTENEESLAAIALLKKKLLAKTNEAAKEKANGIKLAAELKQLKVDLNKLIGMWEPPPSTGEHIVLTLDDEKKEAE
jgi:uncharacterized protein YlxW (UPF0749 family)